MLKESDIVYENGKHWVLQNAWKGFEVYRSGITHSDRRAIIGWKGGIGLQKAIAEADRREFNDACTQLIGV